MTPRTDGERPSTRHRGGRVRAGAADRARARCSRSCRSGCWCATGCSSSRRCAPGRAPPPSSPATMPCAPPCLRAAPALEAGAVSVVTARAGTQGDPVTVTLDLRRADPGAVRLVAVPVGRDHACRGHRPSGVRMTRRRVAAWLGVDRRGRGGGRRPGRRRSGSPTWGRRWWPVRGRGPRPMPRPSPPRRS